jgi:hypothetical protein
MLYGRLADLVLVVHLGFVLFVALGGLLVLRRPRLAWAHLPAAVWGVLIEYSGWTCPLTPVENALRERSGAAGYAGGFIDYYVTGAVYPEGLTRAQQMALGTLALLVNALCYRRLWLRARR